MKAEIIAATIVVVRYPNARVCAECQKPVSGRVLRVAEKHDGVVSVVHYCPFDEEDHEQRACAPRDPKVHAALRRKAIV